MEIDTSAMLIIAIIKLPIITFLPCVQHMNAAKNGANSNFTVRNNDSKQDEHKVTKCEVKVCTIFCIHGLHTVKMYLMTVF